MPDIAKQAPADDVVNIKAVVWSAVAILAALIFAAGLAYFIFAKNRGPHGYSGPNAAPEMQVAGPVLESVPVGDRHAFETEKRKLVDSWDWVDRPAGVARIPVEEAMRLLAAQNAQGAGRQRP